MLAQTALGGFTDEEVEIDTESSTAFCIRNSIAIDRIVEATGIRRNIFLDEKDRLTELIQWALTLPKENMYRKQIFLGGLYDLQKSGYQRDYLLAALIADEVGFTRIARAMRQIASYSSQRISRRRY